MTRTLVAGAGKSGVAAANFVASRGDVVICDSRPEGELPLVESLHPSVKRHFGDQPESLLEGVSLVVLSPGIPPGIPLLTAARRKSIPVISEIELAFRNLRGKVVAITGSNGKSTTTALLGEIFKVAGLDPVVAGNIGEPLVNSVGSDARNYVVELSSFQLEAVDTFRADVALLLNITPDHMDRYASLEEYASAKNRIFRNQQPADFAVVNGDDPLTRDPLTAAQVWRFSSTRKISEGAWLDGDELALSTGESQGRIPRSALRLEGNANVENALAAWLAARAAGVSDTDVERGFRQFAGLPHRMVLVRELDGIRFVNDSKGTNVDATLKSLEGLPDAKVLLILGGKDKNGEFERLRDLVRRKTKAVLTIGSAASRIESALGGSATIVPAETMQAAVTAALERAAAGDTILLSPACASFDQYRNFEHRGDHFEELVRSLRQSAGENSR